MFENISNINQFANNKQMNMLWNLKKDGLLLPSSPQINASSNKEKTLSSITNKLTSGKRLSPEEMRYLQEHAPELYKQAVEADAERSAYESAAKSCRSKADVQNLHAKSMAVSLASAKSDPMGAQFKAAAVTDAHISFMQSSAYNKLPNVTEPNQSKDENDSKGKKDKVNASKERQKLMQEMTDAEQNIQFTLRNYQAQTERRASAETSSTNEPATTQTAHEEAIAFNKAQSSVESTKAYLQSQGITIENPMENHVSFASLLNTSNSQSSQSNTNNPTAAPVGTAFVGRAHAAYVTARSTVTSTVQSNTASTAVKLELRTKA